MVKVNHLYIVIGSTIVHCLCCARGVLVSRGAYAVQEES